MNYLKITFIFLVTFFLNFEIVRSNDLPKIRIGTLQYGSVNWELDLIKELKIDKQNMVNVEIVQLASKNAAAVALQGKAVDLIVTDWFWVSRQRSQGRMFSFIPHSMAAGGLMVKNDSNIESISDLKNKKIGIAGGQVDKSWLIFRAYYQKKFGKDLIKESKQIFGAPPLLNKKIEQGSFDAILTYWPYQAKLLSSGFKRVINITDIINELGISSNIPIIGWVFRDGFAEKNKDTLMKFVKSSTEAKKVMAESDDAWDLIKTSMNAEDEQTYKNLREVYREGIPKDFSKDQMSSVDLLFNLLSDIGGSELVGKSTSIAEGTFWAE